MIRQNNIKIGLIKFEFQLHRVGLVNLDQYSTDSIAINKNYPFPPKIIYTYKIYIFHCQFIN